MVTTHEPRQKNATAQRPRMNIDNSTAAYSTQAAANTSRPQGPPAKLEDQLASARQSIGVDDATSANVLEQVGEAISALASESTSGRPSREVVQSAVGEVLEANGIDAGTVEEALQASSPFGAGRATGDGRPQGPPPPQEESETSAVESALQSVGAEESSTDELIGQIIEWTSTPLSRRLATTWAQRVRS